jgi:hypothetical protein
MRYASIALLLVGCGNDSATSTPRDYTYWHDVKPIIDAKCTTCHADGGVAPMDLRSWETVAEYLGRDMQKLRDNVADGVMPPWPPNNECATYHGDRSLTQEQIDTFVGWIDGGAVEGDPATEGAPIAVNMPRLSREDLTLEMAEPYMPRVSPDDYRCFLIQWPAEYTTTKYVTGFRANPGDLQMVHHVIVFTGAPDSLADFQALDDGEEGPGWTCFGGPGAVPNGSLGGWAPGQMGQDTPPGTGIAVAPGTVVIMQVHYNTLDHDPVPDLSSMTMKIDDSVDTVVESGGWANPGWFQGNMLIPANEADVMHAFEFDASPITGGEPMTIFDATLHMHTRGVWARLSIERNDGTSDCLLQIDNWDFHWQGTYALVEPKVVMPGDSLRVECHWDNTAENQPIVDGEPLPPQDLNWGEGTTDEMCVAFFLRD